MSTHVNFIDVPEQGEWTDRTLATASWWDRYVIHPGTYPLEFTSINYRPTDATDRPYWAVARVDATLVERYRVNTLLHASSAYTENHHERTTVTVVIYAYEVTPDTTRTVLGGLGTVRSIPNPSD